VSWTDLVSRNFESRSVREIVVSEYAKSEPIHLRAEELRALRAFEPRLFVTPAFTPETYTLTATSYVGSIDLPQVSVRIRPKLPVDRVLFLIGYVSDPDAWLDHATTFQRDPLLVDAVAEAFEKAVRSATRRGLLCGYRRAEEALPVVRGRVRFQDQIRSRFGRLPPVEVAYDDFTEDIDENRLIRAALHQLHRLRIRSEKTKSLLRAAGASFHNITLVDYRSGLPSISYNRLNAHYKPVVELARLIAQNTSVRDDYGSIQCSAFLVDMNVVFEEFVRTAIREALRLSIDSFPRAAAGKNLWLDSTHRIRLEPDLSWWVGPHCHFVGDVKYKKRGSKPFNNDVYQALAYATALNLPSAMLVYPTGEEPAANYQLVNCAKQIEVRTLDLAAMPSQLMAQVRDLVGEIVKRDPFAHRA
jgi:5-methylcytosine-specific restriction enzyme subunit McrC